MKKIPMLEKFAAQSLVEYEGELIFSKEKFAELIVRECANLADDLGVHLAGYHDKDGRDIAYSIRNTIKEHFGVEE